ncbi:hypothetical protein Zmor_020137 [Zophobas morio]|uniref:Uncharacterized protein n=1 Tax=Zophobas morio TaxID=2755281 RepID=A0AA38I4T8_9CUCU|nr:hypothetical protein Zmor_020137 [Zophobas morio]
MTTEVIKNYLLSEAKQEEWRKNIGDEEYKNNTNLVDQLHKRNLEIVARKNKHFRHSKYVPTSLICRQISPKAKAAYQKWKEQNNKKTEVPELPVQNLLLLVHYLNTNPDRNEKKELQECLRRQNSEFETFWDSPSYILKILRKCVLTRDWPNMTFFLLILLNYDKKYVQIIKKMCQIMLKFNPLIAECGLEDQFRAFIHSSEQQLVIV